MTVPAQTAFTMTCVFETDKLDVCHSDLVRMASDTVFLDDRHACLAHVYDLGFQAECENARMAQAVAGFEHVLPDNVVVRDVAVVAGSNMLMAAAFPP